LQVEILPLKMTLDGLFALVVLVLVAQRLWKQSLLSVASERKRPIALLGAFDKTQLLAVFSTTNSNCSSVTPKTLSVTEHRREYRLFLVGGSDCSVDGFILLLLVVACLHKK
jgi:hypothetical protein